MFSVCLSTGKEAMMFCRVAKRKAIGEQLGDTKMEKLYTVSKKKSRS